MVLGDRMRSIHSLSRSPFLGHPGSHPGPTMSWFYIQGHRSVPGDPGLHLHVGMLTLPAPKFRCEETGVGPPAGTQQLQGKTRPSQQPPGELVFHL